MTPQIIQVKGRRFVLVPVAEFRRLTRNADAAGETGIRLPPLPMANDAGNLPALDYMRASIARGIIKDRKAFGLTQQALAKLAGIRQETLSRLESGKHSPTVRTVEKIDRALKRMAAARRRR